MNNILFETLLFLLPESLFTLIFTIYILKLKIDIIQVSCLSLIVSFISYFIYNFCNICNDSIARLLVIFIFAISLHLMYKLKNLKKSFAYAFLAHFFMLIIEFAMFLPIITGLHITSFNMDLGTDLLLLSLPTRLSELFILIILFQRRKINENKHLYNSTVSNESIKERHD